jgi:hypothetical protein
MPNSTLRREIILRDFLNQRKCCHPNIIRPVDCDIRQHGEGSPDGKVDPVRGSAVNAVRGEDCRAFISLSQKAAQIFEGISQLSGETKDVSAARLSLRYNTWAIKSSPYRYGAANKIAHVHVTIPLPRLTTNDSGAVALYAGSLNDDFDTPVLGFTDSWAG